ncbi:hypothetical protein ON010_g7309 [Phytophthora cinnamomi]|nr:hypothetical protein ON010_g7309 [Phytophthora cinnamomi]
MQFMTISFARYGIAFSDSPWASPIVIVLKQNGQNIRFCSDYKTVNSVTAILEYAMLLVSDMFSDLAGYVPVLQIARCGQRILSHRDDSTSPQYFGVRVPPGALRVATYAFRPQERANDLPAYGRQRIMGICVARSLMERLCSKMKAAERTAECCQRLEGGRTRYTTH